MPDKLLRLLVVRGLAAFIVHRLFASVYVGAMIAIIVRLDLAFFRQRIFERLMLNAGVVLVFAAFYLRFLGTG